MTPDKYTAIARRLVNEWDFDCHAVFSSLDAISKREMLWNAVAEAIADAVEAERAKARVEMPSDDDLRKRINELKIEPRYQSASGMDRGICRDVIFETYYWLRSHAKIVWGEK